MSYNQNIDRIREVHDALGELATAMVFVGGTTVSLYANRAASEVKPIKNEIQISPFKILP